MWDNILFDLDGTLTDPGEGITGSVRFAMEQTGYPVPPQETLNRFVGPPLDEMFYEQCGFTGETAQTAIRHFKEHFAEYGIHKNKLFEEIPALLRDLQTAGFKLHLATTKPVDFAIRILDSFHLTQYFTCVNGSEPGHNGRPKDIIVQRALEAGHIDVHSAVMVGDRRHDVEGAHKNGIPCIGLLFGYGTLEELETAGADYIAKDIPALRELLFAP